MAVLNAGDILGIMAASHALLLTIDGIESAYMLPPEMAPEDDELPCMIQVPRTGAVSYTVGQEIVNHEWDVYLLVKRGGDIFGELEDVLPFVSDVFEVYRMNTTLGQDIVFDARPTSYDVTTINYLQEQYIGVQFVMQAKAKRGVDMH